MHPSLSHLQNIDQRFLDPDASLVVMCESTEHDLDDVRLSLDGLACLLESAAAANTKLRQHGQPCQYVELPPDSLAALMRVLCDRLKGTTNNPTLGAVQHIRPDLFERRPVGGL